MTHSDADTITVDYFLLSVFRKLVMGQNEGKKVVGGLNFGA